MGALLTERFGRALAFAADCSDTFQDVGPDEWARLGGRLADAVAAQVDRLEAAVARTS